MHESENQWAPFQNRLGFECAEFLYIKSGLSQSNITILMELWAASLRPFGASPPFSSYRDLYATIDAITLGDATWESFSVHYTGEVPAHNPPSWMSSEYVVWFHNPLTVVTNMLSNPDFAEEFDYFPYREYHNGKRQWTDMMSGDWVWAQSVWAASLCYIAKLT